MTDNCATCPIHHPVNLEKLGIDMSGFDYIVALAGNPNTGKSTVFNTLTGLRQHTGNWPGKTVSRAEGAFKYREKRFKLVDLPGTYSLLSTSTDEQVARDFILFGKPDVTVIVADATRLQRNMNLVLQILEITDRAVLCVNLIDEAKRHQIDIDSRALSRELGIPVVGASARRQTGIPELLQKIEEVASGSFVCMPKRIQNKDKRLAAAIEEISQKLNTLYPGLPNAKWIALRLLEGDESIVSALESGQLGNLTI